MNQTKNLIHKERNGPLLIGQEKDSSPSPNWNNHQATYNISWYTDKDKTHIIR